MATKSYSRQTPAPEPLSYDMGLSALGEAMPPSVGVLSVQRRRRIIHSQMGESPAWTRRRASARDFAKVVPPAIGDSGSNLSGIRGRTRRINRVAYVRAVVRTASVGAVGIVGIATVVGIVRIGIVVAPRVAKSKPESEPDKRFVTS